MSAALIPAILLVLVLATDAWVWQDAKRSAGEGSPVVLRLGGFIVDTPAAWFLACLVLWIIFFPIYIVSRAT